MLRISKPENSRMTRFVSAVSTIWDAMLPGRIQSNFDLIVNLCP